MLDWTLNISNLIQIVLIMSACFAMFMGMKNDIKVLRVDLVNMREHLKSLQDAFSQLSSVLVQVAVQDTRLTMLDKRINELSHGHGYVKSKK